ncbi:hypothetical protein PspLS_02359 [Pyricularia sp. CBS 133598]|nr:hypothetical protein PspLS_02359 [Pyricularia sp. CBS 133598]
MTREDNPSIGNLLKSDRTAVRFAEFQGFRGSKNKRHKKKRDFNLLTVDSGRYDNRGKLGLLGCAKRPTVLNLVALPHTGSR